MLLDFVSVEEGGWAVAAVSFNELILVTYPELDELVCPLHPPKISVSQGDDLHPGPRKDEAMLKYTQAHASLPRDCWDAQLWYCCQKEVLGSRNSSAALSYYSKGAQRLQLHWEMYGECATAGSCLSLPRWNRQRGRSL